MNTRRLPLLALAAVAALAFAGCTATGPTASADQSVEDACTVVAGGMQELQGELADMSTEMQNGNLSGLGDALDAMESKLGELLPQVGNEQVKTVVQQMHDALADFTGSLDGVEDLSDLTDDQTFADAGKEMQDAGSEFANLCGGN